jgi:hypothetical protein
VINTPVSVIKTSRYKAKNAPGCLITYGRINKQTRSKKTKYKPQDTATSNPNQGNQNAPGFLITYRRIDKQTRSKKSKRHKEQQVIKYGHTISKYEWAISKYEWVISKYARK